MNEIPTASNWLSNYLRQTALLRCPGHIPNGELALKLECNQIGGSFKTRGGLLSLQEAPANCVVASGGCHLLGAATAAKLLEKQLLRAYVPPGASTFRLARLKELFPDVEIVNAKSLPEAYAQAEADEDRNTRFLHPYRNAKMLLGSATLGYELLQQIEKELVWGHEFSLILAAGGGAMAAGIVSAIEHYFPNANVEVFLVEPEACKDVSGALQETPLKPKGCGKTLASGLNVPEPGETAIELLRHSKLSINFVSLSEKELIQGTNALYSDQHILVEPSGAATYAALPKLSAQLAGKKVLALICGSTLSAEEILKSIS